MIEPKIRNAIDVAISLLPHQMNSPEALVLMYTIGLQESRFKYRRQIVNGKPNGPAKGFWQFERGGGCKGVVEHSASRYWMHKVCMNQGVRFNATEIWNAIETNDVLAAAAARLLIFTDPKYLPSVNDSKGGWNLYIRTWRPGKPHRGTWDGFQAQARKIAST
jgi:hypothetical protein